MPDNRIPAIRSLDWGNHEVTIIALVAARCDAGELPDVCAWWDDLRGRRAVDRRDAEHVELALRERADRSTVAPMVVRVNGEWRLISDGAGGAT